MASMTSSARESAPVSARRAQTRQRLMAAAVTVFAEKGVAGASVEELCEAAGFTRGAFYSNFESKDELCFALLQGVADGAMAALRVALDGIGPEPATVPELVDTAVDTFLATQAQDRAAALLLKELELYALRHPAFAREYLRVQRDTHGAFAALVDDALARRGVGMALPTDQVIEVLHAVQKAAQATELLAPTGPGAVAPQLKALLSALIR